MFAFLAPWGGSWDTPLQGGALPTPPLPPALPVIDPGSARADGEVTPFSFDEQPAIGSNSWAVDGERGVAGAALLANDMHLAHAVPNIWYRLSLRVGTGNNTGDNAGDDSDEEPARTVTGVTLPGLPLVLVGSNGKLAWGFTNSYADTLDLIKLDRLPVRGRFAMAWRP